MRRRSWWSSWPSSAARSRPSGTRARGAPPPGRLRAPAHRSDRLGCLPCPRAGRRRVHLLPDRGARHPVRGHARVRHGVRVPRHEPAGAGAHPADPEGAHRLGGGDRRSPRRHAGRHRAGRVAPGRRRGHLEPAAGAWSRTSAPTPARACSTSTSISWAAARWPGLPVEARPRATARIMRKVVPRTARRSIQEGTGLSPGETYLANATNQVKILVPGHQPMVALLGQRDAFLKLIESAFDSRDPGPRQRDHDLRAARRGRACRQHLRGAPDAAGARQRTLGLRRRRGDPDDQGR